MSGITTKMLQAAAGARKGFDPNTPIGTAIEGGFFAGIIVQGGDEYAIIISPKYSGESNPLKFKTSNTAAPTATQTLNNGPAASASMNSADYPAAQFCEGLSIGDFTDWYLPARDELEICYRNLKPTSASNSTGARAKSDITYPEGDDLVGDTMGVNRNSSPTGAAYTSGSPSQTSVTNFISGGAEAFDSSLRYWSSSEFSTTGAWRQLMDVPGLQNSIDKDANLAVRAIRRVLI